MKSESNYISFHARFFTYLDFIGNFMGLLQTYSMIIIRVTQTWVPHLR